MMRWVLVSVLALCGAMAVAAGEPGEERSLRVDAVGEASAYPDMVVFSFAVGGEGDTVEAAREAAGKKQEAVTRALAAKGVGAKELTEVSFSLSAVRARSGQGTLSGPLLGFQLARGYRVSLPLSGPEGLSRVMDLVSAATAAGAEPPKWREGDPRPSPSYYESQAQVQEMLQFTLKDPAVLRRKAVAAGVAQARENADLVAKANGQRVTALYSANVRENISPQDRTWPASSTVWQELRVRVPVTVTFAFGP